jgi:hypothetical protein
MSDEYGMTAAAKTGLRIFEMSSRGSGRTARLVERVTDEDQIITPTREASDYIRHRLRDAGKKTRVFTIPVDRFKPEYSANGRTFFDHTWIEQYMLQSICRAEDDIEAMQRAMSKTWPEAPPKPDSLSARWLGEYAVRV